MRARVKTEHLALGAILLVGLALRLYRLDTYGFWGGEIHTIFHSVRPIEQIPAAFRDFTAHPPLWFIMTGYLLRMDDGVGLVRLPAVILGILAIPICYRLFRRSVEPKWALLSCWMLAILPISLRWSQSARMYIALMVLSALTVTFAIDLKDRPNQKSWIGLAVVSLINLYVHYFALFPLLVVSIFLYGSEYLLRYSASSSDPQFGPEKKPFWTKLKEATKLGPVAKQTSLALIVVLAGYLPWAWSVGRYNFFDRQLTREENQPAQLSVDFVVRWFQDILGGATTGSWWWLYYLLFLA
jgi:hypothetical protein